MSISLSKLKVFITNFNSLLFRWARQVYRFMPKLSDPELIIIFSSYSSLEVLEHEDSYALVLNPHQLPSTEKLDQIKTRFKKSKFLIIQLSIMELIASNEKEIADLLKPINEGILALSPILRRRMKIYLEFNELNKLKGYSDYFKHEKKPAFGLQIDFSTKYRNDFLNKVSQAYTNLCNNLNSRTRAKIYNESTIQLKKRIYLFNESIKHIKPKVLKLIELLIELKASKKESRLMGIYFSGNGDDSFSEIATPNIFECRLKTKNISEPISYRIEGGLSLQALEILKFKKGNSYLKLISRSNLYLALSFVIVNFSIALCLQMQNEYKHELKLAQTLPQTLNKISEFSKLENPEPIQLISALLNKHSAINTAQPLILVLPYSYSLNSRAHQLINPRLTKAIYAYATNWLERLLRDPELKTADRLIATQSYLSLSEPKNQNHFTNALCYFWLNKFPNESPRLCSKLNEWLSPQFILIDENILNKSKESLLSHSLAARVFSSFYAHSVIKENNRIYFNKSIDNSIIDENNDDSLLRIFSKSYSTDMTDVLGQYTKDSHFLKIYDEAENLWNNEYQGEFNKIFHNKTQSYWLKRLKSIHIKAFQSSYEIEKLALQIKRHQSSLETLTSFVSQYQPKWLSDTGTELKQFNYTPLANWLIQINRRLHSVSQSKNPGKESFGVLCSTLQAKQNSDFAAVIELAKSAPFPLSQWIYEIYSPIWRLFSDIYISQINEQWQNQVMPFYTENIKDQYPLSETGSDLEPELSINDFQYFFAPKQLLDNFFNEYLSKFFEDQQDSLHLKNNLGLRLPLSDEDLIFLNSLFFIKKHYFDQTTGLAKLEFRIKPLELSRSTRFLKLNLGSSHLDYQHGPQFNTKISWPNANGSTQSSLKLTNFNSHNDELKFTGDWSIFHLIENATALEDEFGEISLSYELPKQSCRFQISGISDLSLLKLSQLRMLNFPEKFHLRPDTTGDYHE